MLANMKKFQFIISAIALSIINTSSIVGLSFNNALPLVVSAYEAPPSDDNKNDEAFSEEPQKSQDLALLALNPGYAIDGVQNVGEFIQLARLTDEPLSLAGYSLRYTTKSGKTSDIFVFPEGSYMVGETMLLRLASSPEAGLADLTYTKTLALEAGPLELVHGEEVIDSVCWTGGNFCLSKFTNKSGSRTSIVQDLGAREYAHILDYMPEYDPEHPGYQPPAAEAADEDADEATPAEPRCRGLEFSEILTYYDADKSEQFIEIYNSTDESIDMAGCSIKYKNKALELSGAIPADGYFAYRPEISLTKNPTSTNNYEIVDITGDVVDSLIVAHGQKKTTSFAQFGYLDTGEENWLITYSPTPGGPNNFQQYRSCPEGKVINEATGNCVKATTIAETKECPEGKYRNPLTGRCKKIEEDSGLTPCKEGYERNPETNRCRKIRNNDGTDYPLVPQTATEKTTFIAGMAIAAVLLVGAVYIGLQYRAEITRFFRKRLHLKR